MCQVDDFNNVDDNYLDIFLENEESKAVCQIVDEEAALVDSVKCVLESNEPELEGAEEVGDLPLEEKSGGSLKHFVEIGDMLMREGSLLQRLETLSYITERMTDVLQHLSIELSVIKLK